MNVGSLFSGIGGIDLGLERAGMHVAWQCEVDPWCQRVLAKHWPGVPRYGDIRTIDESAPRVDVLAGGFPCQPVSLAGKGLAQRDERWLWPEFARLVRLLRPRYVLVENVPGLLARGMGDVLGDLAACGYDAEWDSIGAVDVGAPHRRRRVWIVAYPRSDGWRAGRPRRPDPASTGERVTERPLRSMADAAGGGRGWRSDGDGSGRAGSGERRDGTDAAVRREGGAEPANGRRGGAAGTMAVASSVGLEGCQQAGAAPRTARGGCEVPDAEGFAERAGLCAGEPRVFGRRRPSDLDRARHAWQSEPDVGRVAHGIPARVDRLRGLGNAVVPQVVEWIGRRIVEDARDRAE